MTAISAKNAFVRWFYVDYDGDVAGLRLSARNCVVKVTFALNLLCSAGLVADTLFWRRLLPYDGMAPVAYDLLEMQLRLSFLIALVVSAVLLVVLLARRQLSFAFYRAVAALKTPVKRKILGFIQTWGTQLLVLCVTSVRLLLPLFFFSLFYLAFYAYPITRDAVDLVLPQLFLAPVLAALTARASLILWFLLTMQFNFSGDPIINDVRVGK
jgi:hypothetical protein